MANEAVLVQDLEDFLFEVKVADGATIEKGTIMQLASDPNTCTASSGDNQKFAGITAVEKVASDGQTRIPVWRYGVFDIKCTAAGATLGVPVKIAGANTVTDADDAGALAIREVVGLALETGGNGEVIEVLVGAF